MKNIIVTLLLAVTTTPFAVQGAESPWYWVSLPSNPEKGYFIEGPNTIGITDDSNVLWSTVNGRQIIKAIQTPLPDNFMEVMEMTEKSKKCSDKLDSALSKMREYDSNNEILIQSLKEELINEESFSGRLKLLERVARDAEKCLEQEGDEERKEEAKAEKLVQEKKHQRKVEKAIKECDLEFFEEEMTDKERKESYKERMNCGEKASPVAELRVTNRADLLKQIQSLLELIIQLKAQLVSRQGV